MNLTYKRRIKRKIKRGITAVFAALLLTGCANGIPMVSDVSEVKAYTQPESMIIVATERNRYQQIYTSQIFRVKLPDGQSFEQYLLEQSREFLQEMKMMTLLAKENNITVTSAEKEEIRKLSEEYYESLSKDDIDFMGVSEDDVQTVYEAYYLSNKVVSELTKNMNLEISDSEAKVITIEQITLSDEAVAAGVLAKVQEDGADFAAIAKENSEDTIIQRQLGRGEEPGALETGAFDLTAGEISQVIEEDGKYYIVKCIDDYDEDATQARKNNLFQERKKDSFGQIYNQFKTDNPVTFHGDMWDKISFSNDDKTTTTNFFELYKQYFPE